MKIAKAYGADLPISTKQSVEVCNFVRYKTTDKAKKLLQDVINKKIAVPYKRYKRSIPHRKGNIATGRYPTKTSEAILKLIKNAEDNAQNLGLTGSLMISHISAHRGATRWHYGRQRRIKMKNTNIRVEVREKEMKKEVKEK